MQDFAEGRSVAVWREFPGDGLARIRRAFFCVGVFHGVRVIKMDHESWFGGQIVRMPSLCETEHEAPMPRTSLVRNLSP